MNAYTSYSAPAAGESDRRAWRSEAPTAMWQLYALMAKDQIDEHLREAEARRLDHQRPHTPRQHRRIHLPAAIRHSARPSSRAV